MGHRLDVGAAALDGRDVATWAQRPWTGDVDAHWRVLGERYMAEHPRTGRLSEAQRLALLRRLAASPASQAELLAAMRSAGYVGATDLENRMRELRAGDTRAGGRAGLAVHRDGDRWALTEPFPALEESDRRALGFAASMIDRLDGPTALQASAALARMLPGVGGSAVGQGTAGYAASPADLERFHAALQDRRPLRIRYYSLHREREATYTVVPVEYVTVGARVNAICVEVTRAGDVGRELQFALDRLRSAEALPDWPPPPDAATDLERSTIVLHVTDPLYRVMRDRNLFGIAADAQAVQSDEDSSWRVTGSFPVALAWDVMEQLCAWAGNAQVWEPYWLVNAVVRRLAAGLRVMQEGASFEVVSPETSRIFASHGQALAAQEPLPAPAGPRKLEPRE